ncbi:ImmA/IrrE family metallo-endopeptidase [Pseudomonas sp. JH-2]|uniref:ImmA/IrrE family metallo-endopeptidase n=1 Tax=Pseudomonas sp. JH-2 TaxID=3114998 RepID=UPI002E255634|nr:ImmA/IrrE family metallo-endopeptidase [Pseudomonas sp. JH-2]
MDVLDISLSVLEWAASQVGKSFNDLASEVATGKGIDRVLEGKLTVRQLEKVASLTHTPFGFLFLQAPPSLEKPRLPDMRQVASPDPLGPDFFEVLEDVLEKQAWYIDYLKDIGADELSFVGKYSPSAKVEEVARDIAKVAGIDTSLKKRCSNPEEYFRALAERFESIGILVFKNGVVKNSSKRGLSVSEFRGFAICDSMAPAVFINGKDSEAAWIFTLAHEIAHIWIGESGVSDIPSPKDFREADKIEKFCNAVAAELLVPQDEFLALVARDGILSIDQASRVFRVSRLVVGRRAFEMGFISREEYGSLYAKSYKQAGSGGNPYATIPVRNSKKVTSAIVKSTMEGTTLIRDAARLLNVTPETIVNIYKKNIRAHA